MKKKILFTIGALDNGGVAKSLLSLLTVIDKEHYDISLLIVGRDQGRNNDVPQGVRIYTNPVMSAVVGDIDGIKYLLMTGHLLLLIGCIIRLMLSVISKPWAGWWLAKLMPVVTKEEYDLIVDYNGQHMLYYMVDKLKGRKKVTFFHSDYKRWRYYERMDRCYYKKVDKIFTISDICVNSLKEIFPEVADKVSLMENISSPTYINRQALQPIDWNRRHKYVLISLGHVCVNKGSDLAMQVAKRLNDEGIDFEWLFLGTIFNDMDYQGFVNRERLTDHISFLGNVKNPYPYIKKADLFVHLSRFEGKSIALDEAKIMCKPIVVTNFSSVNDQFTDGVNSIICEMSPEDATHKIIALLLDDSLRKKLTLRLQSELHDNSSEVEKIYNLVDIGNE